MTIDSIGCDSPRSTSHHGFRSSAVNAADPAFGSPSVGHWLFLAAFVLLVIESLVWQMLLPRLARDFDKVMR